MVRATQVHDPHEMFTRRKGTVLKATERPIKMAIDDNFDCVIIIIKPVTSTMIYLYVILKEAM